jgi:23S rRNA (guanosine2251-2'-O)-methyltransferase
MPNSDYFICGKNPSFLCLKNGQREVYKIYTSDIAEITRFIKANNIPVNPQNIEYKTNRELDRIIKNNEIQHQGIALRVGTRKAGMDFDSFIIKYKNETVLPRLLVLDEITDPHNMGAIMRTAAAFGVNYIITTEKNSVKDSPVIAKTSAGYSEIIELMDVVNLNRALGELKNIGYFVIGLDGGSGNDIRSINNVENICLVLGSEGRGIRRLVKENCDALYGIKMQNNVESLNVSVACGVAVYWIWGLLMI